MFVCVFVCEHWTIWHRLIFIINRWMFGSLFLYVECVTVINEDSLTNHKSTRAHTQTHTIVSQRDLRLKEQQTQTCSKILDSQIYNRRNQIIPKPPFFPETAHTIYNSWLMWFIGCTCAWANRPTTRADQHHCWYTLFNI